jgi:hypothetical protein
VGLLIGHSPSDVRETPLPPRPVLGMHSSALPQVNPPPGADSKHASRTLEVLNEVHKRREQDEFQPNLPNNESFRIAVKSNRSIPMPPLLPGQRPFETCQSRISSQL